MSSTSTPWLFYAIASGGCAALNGVFAKLTTTQLTTTFATGISHIFGFSEPSRIVELLVRSFFFLMNLAFNAVMWGLFTRALTLATSTVRVSVINTSANFMLTAVLGAAIFRESLPGSVIIGRREGTTDAKPNGTTGSAAASEHGGFQDDPDAPLGEATDGNNHDQTFDDSIELDRKPKRSVLLGAERHEL
ncbi:hypothetical protein LTR22_025343 [Elasticomyces elasticus]|nr:hypothetical protein LTR22_025343 [Elasticomyces elasticus]KAK4913999.1 hypothetical protein LTR49_017713 [Elasticomyces elasticus]